MNYNKNQDKLLAFVKESLELLEIKKENIIIHQENNIYKKVYLSNSLTHDGMSNHPPRKEIFDIYNIMIRNALYQADSYQKVNYDKIYISRRTWKNNNLTDNIGTNYTTRRKMMNEDSLVEMLNEKGFIEIFGENYSMIEKIILFNNANYVIGAIGGTITNCIFCKSNSKIITLVSPEFLKINYRMKYLFGKNVLLFDDTYLDCNEGEIAPNIRIEITDSKLEEYRCIGEIIRKCNNGYEIKLGKNYIGFNENDKYEKIYLKEEQFKKLDNGINSPWNVNMKEFIKIKIDNNNR